MIDWDKYYDLYEDLVKISEKLLPYYDVDKVKPYCVYVWSKGENGKNVFDIFEDELAFFEEHEVIEESIPVIEEIQNQLKEMRLTVRGKLLNE